MRVFIFEIAYAERHSTYDFTTTARTAYFWNTRDKADKFCQRISDSGITVDPPFGNRLHCAGFRVEERPQGGFAISCECPLTSACDL